MTFTNQVQAVAICHTPYKQKFGIPRQPGLVKAAHGYIELQAPFNHIDAVRGLEQYSHIWLLFSFHENLAQGWKTTVRPPRLGGNESSVCLLLAQPLDPMVLASLWLNYVT